MTHLHQLIAFLATLSAIVVLVILGAYMATQGKPAEALGIGGAVTGLIGVIGTFRPRHQPTEASKEAIQNEQG